VKDRERRAGKGEKREKGEGSYPYYQFMDLPLIGRIASMQC